MIPEYNRIRAQLNIFQSMDYNYTQRRNKLRIGPLNR